MDAHGVRNVTELHTLPVHAAHNERLYREPTVHSIRPLWPAHKVYLLVFEKARARSHYVDFLEYIAEEL